MSEQDFIIIRKHVIMLFIAAVFIFIWVAL